MPIISLRKTRISFSNVRTDNKLGSLWKLLKEFQWSRTKLDNGNICGKTPVRSKNFTLKKVFTDKQSHNDWVLNNMNELTAV